MKYQETPARTYKRAFAYLIDLIFVNLTVVLPFEKIIRVSTSPIDLVNTSLSGSLTVAILIILVFTILYFTIFEFIFKQTPGKAIMHITVQSLHKELTFWQALIRNLPKCSTLLVIIDSLYLLKKTHERFFDKIAHTKVIESQ